MAWLVLALALAGAPQQADSLGRYDVRDSVGRTLCTVSLSRVPDVGGEIERLSGCVGPLAPLREASLWQDDGHGGFVFRDPIRRTVATVGEDEAGLTLHIGARSWDFVKLDRPPVVTPAQRTLGSWSLHRGKGPRCHVEFINRGIMMAPACPAPFKAVEGRWSADDKGVTLRIGKAVRAFRWSDPATLKWGDWILLRD